MTVLLVQVSQSFFDQCVINSLIMSCIIVSVERILKAKTVAAASPMAPACGLYLGHVKYDLPSET